MTPYHLTRLESFTSTPSNATEGIEFDRSSHTSHYGIEGLGKHTIITGIPDIFAHSGERAEGFHTPDIKGYVGVADSAE